MAAALPLWGQFENISDNTQEPHELRRNFHINFAETFHRLFIDGIAATVTNFPIFG